MDQHDLIICRQAQAHAGGDHFLRELGKLAITLVIGAARCLN